MTTPFRYVAIEGPIGVGKTTLCQLLSQEFNFRLVLEEVEENPFLSSFYKDRTKFAFQTQIYFLLSRYRQQQTMVQQELFHEGFVSDYIFPKDRIFAHLNLSEEELSLYESVYSLLDARILKPDLVIFLQASIDVLKERIKKRNFAYEKNIDLDYLKDLVQAYNQFFFTYHQTPLLVVNCSELDYVTKPEDYQNLLHEILQMKKKGLEKHYISISSR